MLGLMSDLAELQERVELAGQVVGSLRLEYGVETCVYCSYLLLERDLLLSFGRELEDPRSFV